MGNSGIKTGSQLMAKGRRVRLGDLRPEFPVLVRARQGFVWAASLEARPALCPEAPPHKNLRHVDAGSIEETRRLPERQ